LWPLGYSLDRFVGTHTIPQSLHAILYIYRYGGKLDKPRIVVSVFVHRTSHHILLDWCAYIKWGIIGQTAQYIKFICH
jgi:hypothetical protein